MKTVVLLLILIFFANGEEETKIVGGEELDDISDYMYVVALVTDRNEFACGGTLIDPRHVLTAGHCHVRIAKVVVGSNNLISDGKVYSIKRFTSHPDYSIRPSPINDIAVITLSEDVSEVTEFPKRATAELNDYETPCKVLGKGFIGYPDPGTPSKKLKLGYVTPVPISQCRDEWKEGWPGVEVPDRAICAYDEDTSACKGDSGGPLFCNEELTGVVSFGKPCKRGIPEVYMDVYAYNDWIDCVIKHS